MLQDRLTSIGFRPDVMAVGFFQEPKDIGKFLESIGFLYCSKIPIRNTGLMAEVYSPSTRNNPQFSFTSTPISDWESITESDVVAEGILTISYPITSEMKLKYDSLIEQLDRNFRVIFDF